MKRMKIMMIIAALALIALAATPVSAAYMIFFTHGDNVVSQVDNNPSTTSLPVQYVISTYLVNPITLTYYWANYATSYVGANGVTAIACPQTALQSYTSVHPMVRNLWVRHMEESADVHIQRIKVWNGEKLVWDSGAGDLNVQSVGVFADYQITLPGFYDFPRGVNIEVITKGATTGGGSIDISSYGTKGEWT